MIASLFLFGPRIALFIWWLVSPFRFITAFDTWVIPLVFGVFAPFTMIAYLIVWSPENGVQGIDWLWMGIGIFLDISSYTGGGLVRRRRFRTC